MRVYHWTKNCDGTKPSKLWPIVQCALKLKISSYGVPSCKILFGVPSLIKLSCKIVGCTLLNCSCKIVGCTLLNCSCKIVGCTLLNCSCKIVGCTLLNCSCKIVGCTLSYKIACQIVGCTLFQCESLWNSPIVCLLCMVKPCSGYIRLRCGIPQYFISLLTQVSGFVRP